MCDGLTGLGVDGARDRGFIGILDFEGAALLGTSGRGRGSVLALRLASGASARGGRDPEVGGAGVEVDEELLGRGADGDRASPLEVVLLVGERLGLALGEVGGEDGEGLDGGASLEDVRADVLLEVDQVRTVLARGRGERERISTACLHDRKRKWRYMRT